MNFLGRRLSDFAARPVSFLLTFAIGAGGAFAYSYIPLHAADERRIERLEAELASQTERAVAASAELGALRAETRERPDPEALTKLIAENDEQRRKLTKLEDEVAYARKRVSTLQSQRNKARRELKVAKAEREKIEARSASRESIPAAPPAAPGPPAAPAPPLPELSGPSVIQADEPVLRGSPGAAGQVLP